MLADHTHLQSHGSYYTILLTIKEVLQLVQAMEDKLICSHLYTKV